MGKSVKLYVSGKPVETGAIVGRPDMTVETIPYFTKEDSSYCYIMDEKDIVYGLGENVRGINKRGWIYVSDCSDNPNHREDTRSLYGAHNFFIVCGEECFGVFVDTPGKVTFDIGYTHQNSLRIMPKEDHKLYFIEGDSPQEIVTGFRRLIGRSYIPPLWAFGYGQSRWSYMNSDEVREVARKHKEAGLPLDSIYLDIDYMEAYKDFTINRQAFPDFEELVKEMRSQGIHLVPIIDAGVKVEEGYPVYEEGCKEGYFCKDENGEDYVVGVWPGKCVFPDMLDEKAREWFGNQYRFLLEKGIDGFWNDMNEPAIFYSEKRLRQVFERIEEYKQRNLDIRSYFRFQDLVGSLANNEEDYRSFYHNYRGENIRHDKVHNLFGYYMTRAAGDAFEKWSPDKRILMYSRASYIGMHRHGGIWMGDNLSWWSHLEMNIKMLPSLNMCGFLYVGADLGGFGADTTQDLMLRWLAFGIFVPLMRNHSAQGTRRQEVYEFQALDDFRGILSLRYRLLPYLYSEFMKAALGDTMYSRPLGFVYPADEIALETEDQLFIGESIMIAPVYKQNTTGRMVYCPEEMKLLRFKGAQVTQEQALLKGHHYIRVEMDEVVVFIRKGHILPISKGGRNVEETDFVNLEYYHFGEPGDFYEMYHDDGITTDISIEENVRKIYVEKAV